MEEENRQLGQQLRCAAITTAAVLLPAWVAELALGLWLLREDQRSLELVLARKEASRAAAM